jgi:2-hydroxychromene-2-carboxylate isomerase
VFPVNSVKAMRGALAALDAGCVAAYSRAAFEAYWAEDRDISREDVLVEIAARVGLDPAQFRERIASPEVKRRLRANTDELIARGGFGSPTIIVGGNDLYFGNDRLCLVREALSRGSSTAAAGTSGYNGGSTTGR